MYSSNDVLELPEIRKGIKRPQISNIFDAPFKISRTFNRDNYDNSDLIILNEKEIPENDVIDPPRPIQFVRPIIRLKVQPSIPIIPKPTPPTDPIPLVPNLNLDLISSQEDPSSQDPNPAPTQDPTQDPTQAPITPRLQEEEMRSLFNKFKESLDYFLNQEFEIRIKEKVNEYIEQQIKVVESLNKDLSEKINDVNVPFVQIQRLNHEVQLQNKKLTELNTNKEELYANIANLTRNYNNLASNLKTYNDNSIRYIKDEITRISNEQNIQLNAIKSQTKNFNTEVSTIILDLKKNVDFLINDYNQTLTILDQRVKILEERTSLEFQRVNQSLLSLVNKSIDNALTEQLSTDILNQLKKDVQGLNNIQRLETKSYIDESIKLILNTINNITHNQQLQLDQLRNINIENEEKIDNIEMNEIVPKEPKVIPCIRKLDKLNQHLSNILSFSNLNNVLYKVLYSKLSQYLSSYKITKEFDSSTEIMIKDYILQALEITPLQVKVLTEYISYDDIKSKVILQPIQYPGITLSQRSDGSFLTSIISMSPIEYYTYTSLYYPGPIYSISTQELILSGVILKEIQIVPSSVKVTTRALVVDNNIIEIPEYFFICQHCSQKFNNFEIMRIHSQQHLPPTLDIVILWTIMKNVDIIKEYCL